MTSKEAPAEFYEDVLSALTDANIPFLVGGTYAYSIYTGLIRPTKDFDLFVHKADYERISQHLESLGFKTEYKFPHWLGKVHKGEYFIDLCFGSANGVAMVDEQWFSHGVPAKLLGHDILLVPPEEIVWHKALLMERERYDGADVIHMFDTYGDKLDWNRLVGRFGTHYRVLLSHMILYGYVFPSRRSNIPVQVLTSLLQKLYQELTKPDAAEPVCYGTILSRQQYLDDITAGKMIDARLQPLGSMSAEDIALWTAGIAIDGTKA